MKITIIGAGNMGGAIARGLTSGEKSSDIRLTCTARTEQTLAKIRNTRPEIHTTTDNVEAVKGADIVLLAVKPWFIRETLIQIRPVLDLEKQIVVSVAAGISFDELEQWLVADGDRSKPTLFRAIPNTAAAVGESMTFLAPRHASAEQQNLLAELFGALGEVMIVDEKQLEVGMALASCGIAYALRYVRAATEGGVQLGMRAGDAQRVVVQTIKGAAALLAASGNHPEAEIDKVTTPGGITIRGLNEMERSGFTAAVINGLLASK